MTTSSVPRSPGPRSGLQGKAQVGERNSTKAPSQAVGGRTAPRKASGPQVWPPGGFRHLTDDLASVSPAVKGGIIKEMTS